MVQIARAPAEHALQVFGAREVILFVPGHQRGIQLGHGKAGTNAPPQVVADHHLGAGVVTLGQLRGVQFTHGVAFGHDGRLAVAGGVLLLACWGDTEEQAASQPAPRTRPARASSRASRRWREGGRAGV